MLVEWINDAAAFAALAGEWDRLLPVGSSPFDLHCWYQAWFEAFGAGLGLSVCTVRRDGRLVAAFPMAWDRKILRPLANVHSSHFRPIAADPEAMRAMVDAVLDCGAIQIDTPLVPCGDPCLEAIDRSVRHHSVLRLAEPGCASPMVRTDGDHDDWLRLEHKKWKAGINRHRRKMLRDHECEFRIAQAPEDLEAELERGLALEAASWKGETGTAIASDPCTLRFYRGVAEAFAARDELRFSSIELDGDLAAFAFGIEHGRRLYSLKIGYDEAHRKLSPGLVLQMGLVEHAFASELDAYEILGDNNYWKEKLANSVVEHIDLRLYRRSPTGVARFAYRAKIRPMLKSSYRRFRSPGHFDRSLPQ